MNSIRNARGGSGSADSRTRPAGVGRAVSRRSALTGGSLALGAIALGAITGCSAPGQQALGSSRVRLDLAHVGDLNSPQQRIAEMLRDELKRIASDVDLVIHDSGTLGSEAELQSAALDGTIDLVIAGSFSHFTPWAGILETPMLFHSNDDFRTFSQGPVGADVLDMLTQELGTVPLFIAPHEGPRAITTASTPISHPDDLRGLKLRNPEVPSFTVMANAVGATPVALDFSELYLALDRGVVDGQHNPLGNIVGQSFQEVQGYLSMVPWGTSPHVVTASRYTWDRLGSPHQEALQQASTRVAETYFDVAAEETQERLTFLEGQIEIQTVDAIDIPAFDQVLEDAIPELTQRYDDRAMKIFNAIREAR